MKDLIACCGLDCEKCDARIATLNNDNELREKTAKLWSELNQTQITPEMINCTGCTVGKVHTPYCESFCQIRKCALSKHYKTCGECEKMNTCDILSAITQNNPDAVKNLKD